MPADLLERTQSRRKLHGAMCSVSSRTYGALPHRTRECKGPLLFLSRRRASSDDSFNGCSFPFPSRTSMQFFSQGKRTLVRNETGFLTFLQRSLCGHCIAAACFCGPAAFVSMTATGTRKPGQTSLSPRGLRLVLFRMLLTCIIATLILH